MRDWKKESQSFDGIARSYDTYRPAYPQALVEKIITAAGLVPGSRIVEVGSGTGKSTRLFAHHGFNILCIEPGANLAAVAAASLQDDPGVTFAHRRFEDWDPAGQHFDLLIAAQAWHWVPKEAGFPKAAHVLKANGVLAIFWNWPLPLPDPPGAEIQQLYRTVAPEIPAPSMPEVRERATLEELQASPYFTDVTVNRFPWSESYTTPQYLGVVGTYSDIIILPAEKRQALISGIAAVLDRQGGSFEKPYLAVLFTAHKATSQP